VLDLKSGKKYRLKTLGLEAEFRLALDDYNEIALRRAEVQIILERSRAEREREERSR